MTIDLDNQPQPDEPRLTDEQMRERMRRGWRAGAPHTACGNGSLPKHTKNVRAWLPKAITKYDILSIADAGAGDLAWLNLAEGEVDSVLEISGASFQAYDLLPRRPGVKQFDICSQVLPQHDLIICRFVLNHLDRQRVGEALRNFQASCSHYLAATQFNGDNLPERSRQFHRLDLRDWLGEPIDQVQDGSEAECALGLWDLQRVVFDIDARGDGEETEKAIQDAIRRGVAK